jgi:hypothetical protein
MYFCISWNSYVIYNCYLNTIDISFSSTNYREICILVHEVSAHFVTSRNKVQISYGIVVKRPLVPPWLHNFPIPQLFWIIIIKFVYLKQEKPLPSPGREMIANQEIGYWLHPNNNNDENCMAYFNLNNLRIQLFWHIMKFLPPLIHLPYHQLYFH